MGLILQDTCFSYDPFLDRGTLRRFLPGTQKRHKRPTRSSRLVWIFHEKLLQRLSEWSSIIHDYHEDEWDLRLLSGERIEIKAWHCRLQGRKNWIFWPRQLDEIWTNGKLDGCFVALFCYSLGNFTPEQLSQQYGRNFLQRAQSVFVIFMKYADCLDLYKQGLMNLAISPKGDRRILLFRHVLSLIHKKLQQWTESIFSNILLPDHPTLGLIGRWTRERVKNVVVGCNVDPVSLFPRLGAGEWRQAFWKNPLPVI